MIFGFSGSNRHHKIHFNAFRDLLDVSFPFQLPSYGFTHLFATQKPEGGFETDEVYGKG
jgi:hypothetical protein